MQRRNGVTQALQGGVNLQEAAWIGSSNDVGRCAQNMLGLAFPQLTGWFRLDQVVNARAAAADIGLRDIHHLETGNIAQHFTRLEAHALGMSEVAGVMVGHTQ